jgi:hypothetical protein
MRNIEKNLRSKYVRRKLCISILFTIIISTNLLLSQGNVKADMAPPMDAPVGNLGPYQYQKTNVKMLEERVQIELTDSEFGEDSSKVVVNANFVFRNLGRDDEKMEAIFPFTDINNCYNDYFYEVYKPAFKVSIDGKPIQTTEISTPSQVGETCNPVNWGKFEIDFPSKMNVSVDINYTMNESYRGQRWNSPKKSIYYLLETGAGWFGNIGQAEIILIFPYEITKENVTLPPGYIIQGNQAHWHWENLEPTKYDNLIIKFIEPPTWEKLTYLRTHVGANPLDAYQWLNLADLYKDISYYTQPKFGIESWGFAHQAVHAYQQALEIHPDAVSIRVEYAWFLFQMSDTANRRQLQLSYPSIQRILQELDIVFAKYPDYEQAHGLLDYINCRTSGMDIYCR